MKTLIKNPSQIVSVNTKCKNRKRGKDLADLGLILDHSLLIENDTIKDFIPNSKIEKIKCDIKIDAENKIILPGLIECHTHAAFAGSRANEFLKRLNGATYEEIAASGGGIISTVKAVRGSSFDDLVKLLQPRINNFISQGVTTLEIKSGYGLSFYDEIKLLQVINHYKTHSPINIVPTFLGAHSYPPEYKNDHKGYLKLITDELLPFIKQNKLAEHIDAFCEKSAFSALDIDFIFTKAVDLGYQLRLHTEQFNNVGGLDVALNHKALSVDHLEVIDEKDIPKLASSDTVGVLLPGVSFFLDYNYAPARKLIDAGAVIALSTDFNPGSSNIQNLHFIMSLAALKLKMTAAEIISAVTINAAAAMNIQEKTGSIEIGKKADVAIFDTCDYNDIFYNIGKNLNSITISNGKIVYQNKAE